MKIRCLSISSVRFGVLGGQRKADWMSLRMLSGVKSFELARKEYALCYCFQVTVQKYNQSAGQFPRHISPY